MAQTPEMMQLLIEVGGQEMDKHVADTNKLRTLWNEYMVEPWDCWSIGLHTHTPLNISNNQPIESWHRHGVMRVLKKALRGSTAAVLEHAFPKIVYRDSIMLLSSNITIYHTYSTHTETHKDCMYHSISRYILMCITGISMPDELQMVRELPMDWISTMSYEKAQKWVKMHTPRKQMIYAQSSSSFLVLTTYGEECFKSLTKKLRKGYVALIPHDIHDIQRDTS